MTKYCNETKDVYLISHGFHFTKAINTIAFLTFDLALGAPEFQSILCHVRPQVPLHTDLDVIKLWIRALITFVNKDHSKIFKMFKQIELWPYQKVRSTLLVLLMIILIAVIWTTDNQCIRKNSTLLENIFYEPFVYTHAAVLVKFESVVDKMGGQCLVW